MEAVLELWWKLLVPPEEVALQSLTLSAGLRFAQLSDMGPADGLDNGLEAVGAHVTPLTKTERREPPAEAGRGLEWRVRSADELENH